MRNHIKLLLSDSKIFTWAYKKYLNSSKNIFINNKKSFYNKCGIEIGGPSFIFSKKGPLPFYGIVKRLDNSNYKEKTFWGNLGEGDNFEFDNKKQPGKQIIADATDLSIIESGSYDFILSSHVIEHIANPIKALYEWKRVLKLDGYLVTVAPNMLETFDWKRPLTTLEHIVKDYKENIRESDNTHFDEIINMHDVDVDGTVSTFEEHVIRTLDNTNSRIVHHHTFQMPLLIKLLKYCEFEIIEFQAFKPYHLALIAKKI